MARTGRRALTRAVVLTAMVAMLAGLLAGPAGATPNSAGPGAPPRVIGGQPVTPGQYPWLVAVVDHNEPRPYEGQFCGATVVAPNWVMTAWHCVVADLEVFEKPDGSIDTQAYYVDPSQIDVVAGVTDLTAPGGQRVRAAQVVPLPQATAKVQLTPEFFSLWPVNDMALIRLKAPLAAPPIRLATPADLSLYVPPAQATVAGWGTTVDPGNKTPPSYPAVAHTVTIPMQPDSACTAAHGTAYVKSADLCAGAPGNLVPGKDACYGDSGGPLAAQDPQGTWVQTGIVSFGGETCASNGKPGVYTRVAAFSGWVKGAIGYGPFAGPGPFVAGQLLDFTNKRPSLASIYSWVQTLQRTSPSYVIRHLAAGSAWQATAGATDRLYRAGLGRGADTGALVSWTANLAAGGSLKRLGDILVSSTEFRSRYGTLSDAAFVDHLYQTVLGKTPSAENRAFWLARLRTGTSRGAALVTFAAQPRFTGRIAADTQVTQLWFGMLRTAPSGTQVATWRGRSDALVQFLLAQPAYLGRTWRGINDVSADPASDEFAVSGQSLRRISADDWTTGALRVPR